MTKLSGFLRVPVAAEYVGVYHKYSASVRLWVTSDAAAFSELKSLVGTI